MKWEVVNPGAQRIGSFHPITEGDWTEGAYIFSETEELSRAVNADDLPLLIRLVKNGKTSGEGVDLDGRDSVGRTLLQLAALSGADRCAEYLIEAGVRIGSRTSDGRTALHIAAQYNRANQVKLLIERARELKIENEQRKAERENAKMDEEEDEDEDMDDEDGDDEVDEEDCIRAQLERKKQEQGAGAEEEPAESDEDELDIDGREWDLGMAPIHFAAFFGSNEALKALLDAGAAVVGAKPDDSHDIPALAFAVVNSQVDAARILLAHGVNPDVRDQARNTPLHLAAQMADTQMMRLLLENGANPNSWNRSFRTPLNTLLASPHKYIATDDDGGAGQTVDDPARDPAPPHQVEALRCLLEEFDALPFYTQDALPSTNEQQQFQMQFGGWGNASDHSRLRNTLEQPLHQACALKSPKLAQVVIRHLKRFDNLHNAKQSRGAFALDSINYVNGSMSTALDAVTSDIDNCEAGGGDWRVQRFNSEKNTLKSVSVKSPFVKHLIKKRLAEIDIEIENISFPHKADSEEDREKTVKRLQELKKILESNGAKEFLSIKIDPKDTELKESQEQQKSGNQTGGFLGGFGFHGHFGAPRKKMGRKAPGGDSGSATVQLAFSSLPASIPGMYVRSSNYPDKAKPMYEKFYDAIFKNDIATVKKLASKKIGEQAHACSQVQVTVVCDGNHINAFNGSALNVAISMGPSHAKMVETLLELSQRQFTPLNAMRKKEREHVQSINNYDLARLMNEVKPGQYLNAAGTALCAEYEGPDQNAAEMQLNCVVGPSTLIRTLSSQSFNVLHYAAQHNSVELVRAIAKFCEEHQVMSSFYDEDNTAKPVLNVLLAGVTRQAHTPFELAIALGNVAAAKELLSIGGLVEVSEEEPDEEYAGLDVGGKKMDWALEHHGRVAKKKATRTALHVAAQYNQSESAVFLLESGRSVWEQYLNSKNAYDEEDVAEWVGHFSIDGKDEKGRSSLHYAAAAGHSDVLLSLLERATEGTVDLLSEDGLSALHMSAWLGHMQCMSNLLTWRANPGLPDKKRGWTALSFAAMNDHDKCVRLLLRYMTAEQASHQSNKFSQTAAIVAAYYGSQKSLKVLSSDTQRKCDVSRSDVCGDNALFHAVKQRHVGCVKLLVNEVEPGKGIRENGVGMTTVDCAKASLLLQYRNSVVANGDASDVTAAREIHRVVEEKLGDGREVANTDDVRSVTYIMLQQAAADAEKDMQDGASRRSWRYKPDDTEVQGQTHGGELNMPGAAAILPA